MNRRRLAGFSFVAIIAASSLGLFIAAPAQAVEAADVNNLPPSLNAADYALSVRGMDLYASQSAKAKAAWNDTLARNAASQANLYRAGVVYGNIDPGELASVIPMNGAVDTSLNGKLTKGLTVSNGVSSWTGKGFKFPRFQAANFASLRGIAGGAAGLVVLDAWEHRADIANGVVSWAGLGSADNLVCSDPVAGGANPINFITGQDCNAWKAAQNFTPDQDATPMMGGDCRTASPQVVGPNYSTGPSASTVAAAAAAGPKCRAAMMVASPDGGLHYAENASVYVGDVTKTTTGSSTTYAFTVSQPSGTLPTSNSYHALAVSGYCVNGSTLVNGSPTGNSQLWSNVSVPPKTQSWQFSSSTCDGVTKGTVVFILATTVDWNTGATPYLTGGNAQSGAFYVSGKPMTQGYDQDPPRQLQCQTYANDGSVTNGLTATFQESQLVNGELPAPNCVKLAAGKGDPKRIVITEIGGGLSNVLYDESATAAATDWDAKYSADCGTGATQHTCLLDLITTTDGLSCFGKAAACAGWMSDPQRDTKYQCQYGGKNEPVQQCYIYANLFNPDKVAAGDPYADPSTGKDVGGKTSISQDEALNQKGVLDADAPGRNCFGGGLGVINPLTWFQTGQCILQWAFVPRPTVVQAAVSGMQSKWSATPFAQVPTVLTNFNSVPAMAGCSGIPVGGDFTWPVVWSFHWSFGAACDEPLKTPAAWVSGLLSALIYGGAVLGFTWYVSSALGFRGFGWRRG